jgi:hypothetical protein
MKNINLIIHDSGVAEEGILPSTYVIQTPFTLESIEEEPDAMFHFKMAVHEAYDNVLAAGLCGNVTAHYDFEMREGGVDVKGDYVSMMPMPNWDSEPSWVQYWAVDIDGFASRFAKEPHIKVLTGPQWIAEHGTIWEMSERVCEAPFLDWKESLQQRPTVVQRNEE